ncbi:hypothetical protein SGRIM128S_08408 [Streptomyces griseomycini]
MILGMGGLGHMGVDKIAHALGAEVTVAVAVPRKKDDGLRLGADHYRATSDPKTFEELRGAFDPDRVDGVGPAGLQRLPVPAEDGGHAGQRGAPRGAWSPSTSSR